MNHLDPIVSDLALILAVAGITTLLFKWLKQPVVLGYVVAGFLCSGNFLLEGVSNMEYVDMCKSYRNADVRDGTDSVEKISDEYKVDKQYIKFWHNNREVPANEPIPPEAKPVLRVPVLLPNESIEYVHAPLDATVNDVITMLCDLHDLDRSVSEGMLLYCNKRVNLDICINLMPSAWSTQELCCPWITKETLTTSIWNSMPRI